MTREQIETKLGEMMLDHARAEGKMGKLPSRINDSTAEAEAKARRYAAEGLSATQIGRKLQRSPEWVANLNLHLLTGESLRK